MMEASLSKGVSNSSKKNNFGDEDSFASSSGLTTYKPSIARKSVVIQRGTNNSLLNSGSVGLQSSTLMASPVASFSMLSSTGMNTVKQSSDKGKKDMQDLNERLACYIEKVRFLEAQNNTLIEELRRLKTKWGKETSQVKAMYQAELDEARRLLDDAVKEKSRLEIKMASLEEANEEANKEHQETSHQLELLREVVEKQSAQVIDREVEVSSLRRRICVVEEDKEQDKKLISYLQSNLANARNDLDNESLLHVDAENRRQTLEEELQFLKDVHQQELKELAALAYRDTTAENRQFWRSEMGHALRDVQQVYDDKLVSIKAEVELFYSRKLHDLKTGASRQNVETTHSKEESKRLRSQLSDIKDSYNQSEAKNNQLLREVEAVRREAEGRERELQRENDDLRVQSASLKAEIESVLFELQSIVDAKLSLELEIAAYRKLLEVEEGRPCGTLKSVLDCSADNDFGAFSMPKNSADFVTVASAREKHALKGELNAKTNYQKSAKGPLSVSECAPDGKYIVIDNTSRKQMESLAGWKVVRVLDNNKKVEFVFNQGTTLNANSKIKVWAKGSVPEDKAKEAVVCEEESWGVGSNISTKLYSPNGEERASHLQQTLFV